ncbi:MAG: hypothetical protein JXL82_01750 [Candidatus Omnitrophica bacterium]|nr:hypothetical protein [Candidatus Omnitrophota bacterium]
MDNLKGLATGIGSLPHQDAESALDLIFKYVPGIPFWPQLPQKDKCEGMNVQFSENLPLGNRDNLEIFYEKVLAADVEYFKISQDYASGLYAFKRRLEKECCRDIKYIKIQITGPFTFSAAFNDKNGVALMHDKVFMQAVLKGLNFKARWQIKTFRPFGKKIILFIDEPYLSCFGSAYTPLNRDDVIAGISEFTEGLKADDVLLGVHCCGNTDWSIFTENHNIDLISFDAFGYQDKFVLYADTLKGFLGRGGIICWGIVPTQQFSGEENTEILIRKIRQGIGSLVNKGIDEELIKSRLIISPACGLGTFSVQKADKVFKLLLEVSEFIRKNF